MPEPGDDHPNGLAAVAALWVAVAALLVAVAALWVAMPLFGGYMIRLCLAGSTGHSKPLACPCLAGSTLDHAAVPAGTTVKCTPPLK